MRIFALRAHARNLGIAGALFLASFSSVVLMRPPTALATGPSYTWFKTDTHVHSSWSADAFVDIGIVSQAAKAQGYDGIFLTDHNGGSSFQINNLTANHMVFEDSYTRWTSGTYGTQTSSVNALVSSPVNTGTKSLHLASTSASTGETFVWTKRGPNFRSGDIILKFSLYPTRIDPGSGVYVSATIGGDPRVEPARGYTTSAGVISPGKSTVLVWQCGSARTDSTDPNARVVTHQLSPCNLNQWNSYTITIPYTLPDVPATDKPLDYNGLTYLKMAAAGNGGTADAYFDSYSIDASKPVTPADEFVARTPFVDDFNTSTFKIFPSLEMGQQKHANRFDFGITDPSQFVNYTYGSDGIVPDQQGGYPAQLNHPGITIPVSEVTSTQAKGADFLEVREQSFVDAWDSVLKQNVPLIGTWSSDSHTADLLAGKPATYIYATSLDLDPLMHSLFDGRAYDATNDFGGRVVLNVDPSNSQDPYPTRYPVYVSDGLGSASVHLAVTGGLSNGNYVRWMVNGAEVAKDTTSGSTYNQTKVIDLSGAFTYIRGEIRTSSGSLRALTQPIFFEDVPSLPSQDRVNISSVTNPDGRGYDKLLTKGITASSWDSGTQTLSLTLQDQSGALIETRMSTPTAPQSIKVDDSTVSPAATRSDYDAATSSTWFYDGSAQQLLLKVLHSQSQATVLVAFQTISDTTPPEPPTGLNATTPSSTRVDLTWSTATDNPGGSGVTGYNICRDGTKINSSATTSFSDTTVAPSTPYSYAVTAVDGAGNESSQSVPFSITTPAAPTALFSDGFESGNMANWTNTGLVIQSQLVHSGTYAARGTSTGAATWAYKPLSSTQSDLYYRVWFNVVSQSSSSLYVLKFRTSTGTSILGLYRTSRGTLAYRNDAASTSTTSTTTVSTGVWHSAEVHLVVNGTASQVEVWLDGTKVTALSKTDNFGTTPIGRLQIGENSSGKTYDAAFDDVSADTSFIT